jgi:hypothetical protein
VLDYVKNVSLSKEKKIIDFLRSHDAMYDTNQALVIFQLNSFKVRILEKYFLEIKSFQP